jgi:hypothetical protein
MPKFLSLLIPFCVAIALAHPAFATSCRDEIVALYDGGPLDPFVQPPYRYETTVTAADGTVKYEYITFFDTPLRSMNGLKGQTMYLVIGRDTWSAPGPEGPWTPTQNSLPEDMEGSQRAIRDQHAKNVTDAECLGKLDRDGATYVVYRFTTQTDPGDDGVFFGANHTVFIDPEVNRMMIQEQRGFFAHYQTEPGTDISVAVYTYDPSFAISVPE